MDKIYKTQFIVNEPNVKEKMNTSYETINEYLGNIISDWYRLYNSINQWDNKHDLFINGLSHLEQEMQKEFLERIDHYKEQLIRGNNESGVINLKNKPIDLNGKNYDHLISNFQNLLKFYDAFDKSNRLLFRKVFRRNITTILEERKNFKISEENMNSPAIGNFINDILNDKKKGMTSEDKFKSTIDILNDQERKKFCNILLSNLTSKEFNIIFNAIKNSNKISLHTNRTLNRKMLEESDEKIVEHVKSFFAKLSKSENSVESKAWKIYISHSDNIQTDNNRLMEDIYNSSCEVSLTGLFHSKNKNIIFKDAPPNSRRGKIVQSVNELGKANDHQLTIPEKIFELATMEPK